MFKDYKAYQQGIDRITFLQVLERDGRLDESTAYELDLLLVAAEQYEDAMDPDYLAAQDAEAKAEYEFMQRFEEHFTAGWER
jgi:hypothetical protein